MIKTIFVDLSHLCHRCAFIHSNLTYGSQPTGMLFGVFKSLLKTKQQNPLSHIVLVWDAGHLRRDIESKKGVEEGIISEVYKENRKKSHGDVYDLVKFQMKQQWGLLEKGLSFTSFQQVKIKNYEADDVIATYVMQNNDPVLIVSSDKDFYQLLEPGIMMYDPIKDETMTYESFCALTGLVSPMQWVDCKALMGDSGDNIFGVPGIGEKTALKLIIEHKSIQNLLKSLHEKQNTILSKKEQAVLNYEKRVQLAYSLCKMDDSILEIPKILKQKGNVENLFKFFEQFQFESLLHLTEEFV
jgi:DNA polymerase-1